MSHLHQEASKLYQNVRSQFETQVWHVNHPETEFLEKQFKLTVLEQGSIFRDIGFRKL